MNADDDIRIVTSNNYSDPLPFHLPNITPVAPCLSLYSQRVPHDEFRIHLRQLSPSEPVSSRAS